MTNRYEAAAVEVEARIKELNERIVRFEVRGLHSRIPHIQAEIDRLKGLDLSKWRATGTWAKEIWG